MSLVEALTMELMAMEGLRGMFHHVSIDIMPFIIFIRKIMTLYDI